MLRLNSIRHSKSGIMKYLFIALVSITSIALYGQSNGTDQKQTKYNTKIYLDDEFQETKERDATVYLLLNLDSDGLPYGKANVFSSKKNMLKWEGSFFLFNREDMKKNKYQGKCIWYHSNGKISRESEYTDGLLNGKTVFYNEGGSKTYSGIYNKGKLEGGKMLQYNNDNSTSKIYLQKFDGFYNGWEEESNKSGKLFFDKEAMWLQSKTRDGFFKEDYLELDSKNDFSIETRIKPQHGGNYVFYYGKKDNQNFFGVVINSKGYLGLIQNYEGINVSQAKMVNIKIRSDWNLLKILKMGDEVYVSFNGNVITSYKFTPHYGNYIGFSVDGYFGRLGVSYIMAKEFPYNSRPSNSGSSSNPKASESRRNNVNTNKEIGSQDSEMNWSPAGTGFYIAKNGLIITNYHVVNDANAVGVTQFVDGRKSILKAKVIQTDPLNDLALLQIDDNKFISPGPLPYSITTDVADVGESIFTMGYPLTSLLGDEIKITDGIISARSGIQGDSKMYQITAPMTYGNSGGPLFDKEGNLLGINSSGITNKSVAENTGYSIKTLMIISLLNSSNDPPKIENRNTLKGRPLKEQIKILRDFVPMICIQ